MDGVRAGAALRWSRALVLAAFAWALGTGAHAAGGEAPPPLPLPLLLLLLPVTAAALAPLLGRRLRTRSVIGLLVTGQAAIHGLLALSGSHSRAPHPAPSGHHRAAHQPAVEVFDHLLAADPRMFIGHLVATMLVGWWLAAGERVVWSLVRAAGEPVASALRALTAPRACLVQFAAPAARWQGDQARRPALRLIGHSVVRRGPPA